MIFKYVVPELPGTHARASAVITMRNACGDVVLFTDEAVRTARENNSEAFTNLEEALRTVEQALQSGDADLMCGALYLLTPRAISREKSWYDQ